MKRRPLNSATLATATHKKLIRMSDGTGAQVGVWMINKCKAQMIGEGLYEKVPQEKGTEESGEEEHRREILLY